MSLVNNSHIFYGVLGYPLTHSWSADYFNEKFKNEGVITVFKEFEYDSLNEFFSSQVSLNNLRAVQNGKLLNGFTVTMPYKQEIVEYLDEVDDVAKAIGAVNCVKIDRLGERVRKIGYNTDVVGFVKSFKPNNDIKKAIVFGTGGASKAVCYGLNSMDFEIAQISRGTGYYGYNDVESLVKDGYVNLINTTSVGMYPDIDAVLPVPWTVINNSCYIYDLVYNPIKTKLLEIGERHGATTENGLNMLHIQAEEAWRIWNYE